MELPEATAPVPITITPTRQERVPFLFFVFFGLMNLLIGLSLVDNIVLLPAGLAAFHANSVSLYSFIIGIGAVGAVICHPLVGAFLDRDIHRRRFCLMLSLLLLAIAFLLIGQTTSLVLFVTGIVIAQIVSGGIMMATMATLLLQIPLSQRAVASALVGIGPLVGGVLEQLLYNQIMQAKLVPGISLLFGIMLVVVMVFSFLGESFLPPLHAVLIPEQAERPSLATRMRAVMHAFQDGNFTWTWIARFLISLAYTTTINYSPIMLGDAQQLFFAISVAVLVVMAFLVAKLSDYLQRRKLFVIGASFVFGLGLALLGFSQSGASLMVASALFGMGYGGYQSSDLALASQVLPEHENAARDLGIMNAALFLPMIIAPLIATATLNRFHTHAALCLLLAGGAGIAALCITKVNRIR